MNGPTMLENLQKLPGLTESTWSQFKVWRAEDKEWTAVWSSSGEGYVDNADMKLSNVALQLDLTVTEDQVDGTVASRSICEAMPLVEFVLLEGTANGRRAEVRVYDFIAGSRREFAVLELRRGGDGVMTVLATKDHLGLFPEEARLAKHFSTEENQLDAELREFCTQRSRRSSGVRKPQPLVRGLQ